MPDRAHLSAIPPSRLCTTIGFHFIACICRTPRMIDTCRLVESSSCVLTSRVTFDWRPSGRSGRPQTRWRMHFLELKALLERCGGACPGARADCAPKGSSLPPWCGTLGNTVPSERAPRRPAALRRFGSAATISCAAVTLARVDCGPKQSDAALAGPG